MPPPLLNSSMCLAPKSRSAWGISAGSWENSQNSPSDVLRRPLNLSLTLKHLIGIGFRRNIMITIRPSEERGHNDHGWLDTHFTFSFGDYFDPKHMGFRDLRVINEDWISAGKGFGMHPHRDMEIITYIIEGELNHRDSTGRGAAIKQNDVQRMSAGTGVMHSEVNQSKKPVHLLQILILPEAEGLKPSYEDRTFPAEEKRNQLRL